MYISYSARKWLLTGCGLALLLMMLAFPFGYDQAVFMIGGEMTVKHGAIPYRDFLDTKPPIIFFIYGISSIIFGHHEWSIRAFDALFHIAALFYFFTILKRITADEKFSLLTVFLYALIYSASGFWGTAQAESFALLPSLIVFDCTEKIFKTAKNHFFSGLVAGLASALLFLLKFTFLTVPLGAVIYLLLSAKSLKNVSWKYLAGMAAGFMSLIVCYLAYLIGTHTLARFIESLQWVQGYSELYPLFDSFTIAERYYKMFPMAVIGAFSLSGIILAAIGIVIYFKDHSQRNTSADTNRSSPFFHFFAQFTLALVAVLYERKFFPYHFSRAYWAFVPFAALGIIELKTLSEQFFASWRNTNAWIRGLRYFGMCVLCAVLLFFSPAVRIFSQPLHWTFMRLTGRDVAADVQPKMEQYYYKEEQQLADSLRPQLKPEDKIFVWGNSIGIYFFLEKYPPTIVLTNTPLITSWTPEAWKKTMLDQLRADPPRFFIAESGDDREYISGSKKDSWQHLLEWGELRNFVETKYAMKQELGHFKIFELSVP